MEQKEDLNKKLDEMKALAAEASHRFIQSLAGMMMAVKQEYSSEEAAKEAYNEAGTQCLAAFTEAVSKISLVTTMMFLDECLNDKGEVHV